MPGYPCVPHLRTALTGWVVGWVDLQARGGGGCGDHTCIAALGRVWSGRRNTYAQTGELVHELTASTYEIIASAIQPSWADPWTEFLYGAVLGIEKTNLQAWQRQQ